MTEDTWTSTPSWPLPSAASSAAVHYTSPSPAAPEPSKTAACQDLRRHISLNGYPALLADHCQLVDQVAALSQALGDLWLNHNRLRCLLDLPLLPLPAVLSAPPTAATAGSANNALSNGEE